MKKPKLSKMHALQSVHTVLPASHGFIHEWNELYLNLHFELMTHLSAEFSYYKAPYQVYGYLYLYHYLYHLGEKN